MALTCVMLDKSTGVRGPAWSQVHLEAPSGRTKPMGQPCSPFGPAVLSFFPGFGLGRKIGPTGTSGHPFGPGAVLFWAAAGAIVTMALFWNHLLLFCTSSLSLGQALSDVDCCRAGRRKRWQRRWQPFYPVCWLLVVLVRGRERPASCLRPRSATFPLLHVSPAGSLWSSEK